MLIQNIQTIQLNISQLKKFKSAIGAFLLDILYKICYYINKEGDYMKKYINFDDY